MMPSRTLGGLGEPSVTRIAAISTLAGTACYLVLALRAAGRR